MADDQQENFSALQSEINQTSVSVLLTDANVALTFLSIAETTTSKETAERNIGNARTAYDSIQHFRVRYAFTEQEANSLNATLHDIKQRLETLGQAF